MKEHRSMGRVPWFRLQRPQPLLDTEVVALTEAKARVELERTLIEAQHTLDALDAERRKEAMIPFISRIATGTLDHALPFVGLASTLEQDRVAKEKFEANLPWNKQENGKAQESPEVERYTTQDVLQTSDGTSQRFKMQYHVNMIDGERVVVPDKYEDERDALKYTVAFEEGFVDAVTDNKYISNDPRHVPAYEKSMPAAYAFLRELVQDEDDAFVTLKWTDLRSDPKLGISIETGRDLSWCYGENTLRWQNYNYTYDPYEQTFALDKRKREDAPISPLSPDIYLAMLKESLSKLPME